MATRRTGETSRLELQLATMPWPIRMARAHAAALCRRWGLGDLAPTAELVVSELVTNAIWHAAAGRDLVTLTISFSGRALSIEVADSDPVGPTVRDPGLWDEGGRGTLVVAEHSSRWGWRRHEGGKTVWAELALAS